MTPRAQQGAYSHAKGTQVWLLPVEATQNPGRDLAWASHVWAGVSTDQGLCRRSKELILVDVAFRWNDPDLGNTCHQNPVTVMSGPRPNHSSRSGWWGFPRVVKVGSRGLAPER